MGAPRTHSLTFYFFRPRLNALSGAHPVADLGELLSKVLERPEPDSSLVVKVKETGDSLLLFRAREQKDSKLITLHFFKVKGDIDQLIADLEKGKFDRLSTKIDIGDGKGLLKHAVVGYDTLVDTLIWQHGKSPTLTELQTYFSSMFLQELYLEPLKNSRTDELFEAMDLSNVVLDITPTDDIGAIGLFDLSIPQKISAVDHILRTSQPKRMTLTLSFDTRDNKRSTAKAKAKDEARIWRDRSGFGRFKVGVKVRGAVKLNNRLDDTMLDLVKGRLVYPCKIPGGLEAEDLWKHKETAIIEAITYGRNHCRVPDECLALQGAC